MTARRLIARGLETLAAPIALYALRLACGRGWALAGTIAVAALVLGWQLVSRRRIAPLPAIASAAAVVLGVLGVAFASDRFLQLEPAFHNAVAAIAVAATCVVGRPLLFEVARARVSPERLELARPFTTRATWALAGLCVLRAAGYGLIAAFGSLADTVVARLVLGPAALALFVGALVIRRRLGVSGGRTPDV